MAGGAAIGGTIGAIAGTLIPIPGVGTAVGMAAGSAIGGAIDAGIQSNKAKKARAAIDDVDPDVKNFLTEMKARMKAYKTGSAAGYYKSQIASNTAAIKDGIVQSQGGNTGAVISALQGANRVAGGAVNQTLAELEKNNQFNTSLVGTLLQNISQRRLELGLVDYSQAQANKAQAISDMNNNLMMALAMSDGNFKQSNSNKTPSTWGNPDYTKDGKLIPIYDSPVITPEGTMVDDPAQYTSIVNLLSGLG